MNQIITGENLDGTFNVLIPETDAVFDAQGNPLTAYTKGTIDIKTFDAQRNAQKNIISTATDNTASARKNIQDLIAANNKKIADATTAIAVIDASEEAFTNYKP